MLSLFMLYFYFSVLLKRTFDLFMSQVLVLIVDTMNYLLFLSFFANVVVHYLSRSHSTAISIIFLFTSANSRRLMRAFLLDLFILCVQRIGCENFLPLPPVPCRHMLFLEKWYARIFFEGLFGFVIYFFQFSTG